MAQVVQNKFILRPNEKGYLVTRNTIIHSQKFRRKIYEFKDIKDISWSSINKSL